MKTFALLLTLTLLSACQTLPALVLTGGDSFEVRYDASAQSAGEADAKANQHCRGSATFVSEQTRFDGFAYRTYRCAEPLA